MNVLADGRFAGTVCVCVSSGLLPLRAGQAQHCGVSSLTGALTPGLPLAPGHWRLRGPICSAGIFPKVTLEVAPFSSQGRGTCTQRPSCVLPAPQPPAAQSQSQRCRGRFFIACTEPMNPPTAEGKGQLLPAHPHNRPLLSSPCWTPSSAVQQGPDLC